VFEEYFGGHDYQWDAPGFHGAWTDWDRNTPHNVHSVGKSITSACVGITIDEGFIAGVDEPIVTYLPDHDRLLTGGKEEITIEHLLTMTSGLAWDEWGSSYDSGENDAIALWLDCADPVTCILDKPLEHEPGSIFTYSGGNMVLLGEIIKNATGLDIEDFATRYLFEPLDIDPPAWSRYDNGVADTNDQRLTPRAMVTIGATYLNDGVWDGQQVIPPDWVTAAPRRTRGTRGPTTSCAPSRPTTTPGDDAGTPTRGGPTSSASPGTQSPPSTRGAGEAK
jgi:CubicO group peptidase (beta-lactamase class C family)